jgi:hypothetical protein
MVAAKCVPVSCLRANVIAIRCIWEELASMRRIILLVTVALVMEAMMVAMAAPAFASHSGLGQSYGQCQKAIHPENPNAICLKVRHVK